MSFIYNFMNYAYNYYNNLKNAPYSDQIKTIDNVIYIRGIAVKRYDMMLKSEECSKQLKDWIYGLHIHEFSFLSELYHSKDKIINDKTYKKLLTLQTN